MIDRHPRSTRETQRDQGFTLIELLVVVIIIGILAAIAIPVFLNQRTKAANASLKADLKAMAIAQETWIVDHPELPGYMQQALPGQTITIGGAGNGGPTFTASPGNTITAYITTQQAASYWGSYCISGTNPNASARSWRAYDSTWIENTYYYNGNRGGGFTTWC